MDDDDLFFSDQNHYRINYKLQKMLIKSIDDINKLSLNVKAIIFIDAFNQSIASCEWPNSLTLIEFGDSFNSPVSIQKSSYDVNIIPNVIKQAVSYLPPNLTHLILGRDFNQTIHVYPLKLTHVHYGYRTDSQISNLPDSLLYMCFNNIYNRIEFPNNLTHVHLGGEYNHPLDNLPQSLTHLVTPTLYNIELTNLPSNLIYLRIGEFYIRPLHISYLTKLESLIFCYTVNLFHVSFPDNLEHITFEKGYTELNHVKWPNHLLSVYGRIDINMSIYSCFGSKNNATARKPLYIVDGSGTITIESCDFPTSLYQIIHYVKYVSGIIYIRDTGKHTKGAIH
jgi:hypothetical protein